MYGSATSPKTKVTKILSRLTKFDGKTVKLVINSVVLATCVRSSISEKSRKTFRGFHSLIRREFQLSHSKGRAGKKRCITSNSTRFST